MSDTQEPDQKKPRLDDAASSQTDCALSTSAVGETVSRKEPAPDGDLILIVGPKKRHIRVHSLILKHVSPILKQKLDEQSMGSNSEGVCQMLLPDDDSVAFSHICWILHNGFHELSPISTEKLLKMVLLSIKYGCERQLWFPMYFAFHYHSTQLPKRHSSVWRIAMASYLLRQPKWFRFYSANLVRKYSGSFLVLAKGFPDTTLALKLCC